MIFLLYYSQKFSQFREAELAALMAMNNTEYNLIEFNVDSPFVLIETEMGIKALARSVLIKSIYRFLYKGSSFEEVASKIDSNDYSEHLNSTFKFDIQSFGKAQSKELAFKEIGSKMGLLGRIDLTTPNVVFGIFQFHDLSRILKYIYVGISTNIKTSHHLINRFDLKKRKYIGTTSMDSGLSLLMANCAKISKGDITYDPFTGTGSMLVVASYFGAFTIGSDLDGRQLRGTMKGAKKNTNGVFGNMEYYDLSQNYIGSYILDFSNPCMRNIELIDSIICDPPYCIRASAKKIASSCTLAGENPEKSVAKFPDTEGYFLDQIVNDLLNFSAKHLKLGGRLVYWLPMIHDEDKNTISIPLHPSLKLIHNPCQVFSKWTRYMVIMEKVRDFKTGSQANSNLKEFRQGYFAKAQ
eukprot:NODE_298_length_10484_cov_0.802600.p2 type:complete len:411 gc:universal NODE_298_length_10484_cov_0.802600:3447-4679(+)